MIKKLDPKRLLAPCFEAMGKQPPAPRYGGWEAKGISGHTLGHYLTALSLLYECDSDKFAKETAIYCVDTLAELQDENGYICGFPESESFSNVFSNPDCFTSEGFKLGSWWVPYYTLHKIFRGLLDVYETFKYAPALEVAKNLGNWVYTTTSTLNDKQRLRVLKCEYGGMSDVLARLYLLTKDRNYLVSSRFFTEENLFVPLSKGIDNLNGLHANTQIPKIISAVTLFEATEETAFLKCAKNFFDLVSSDRSYAIGGHSIKEHFENCGHETLATNTCETCNTNNMITLAKKLWNHSHEAKYYDFIEKAMFNHILASQDETGMKTYFVGTKPGNFKVYSTLEDSFWCCFGSGLENPFTFHNHICNFDGKLFVNLYIQSKNDYISINEDTNDTYLITFKKNYSGTVCFRKPCHCKNFSVRYDAFDYTQTENGYVCLNGNFSEGEKIAIRLPRTLEVHNKKDDKSMVFFTFGEFVLAERINGDLPEDDHAKGENDYTDQICPECLPIKSTEVKQVGKETFIADGHLLVPFFKIVHGRYRIYFRLDK